MASPKQGAKAVEALVNELTPHLVGKPQQIQGAALADLLAIWLAGHLDREDPEGPKTEAVREMMLEAHLIAVRALIPINYESRVKPQLRRQQH